MNSEDVARFLQEHPEFFEQYADLMAQIYIPHPHGGRAIPIAERQMLALREKSRKLETKLAELIQFGEENDAISDKLHRYTVSLVAADRLEAVLHAAVSGLQEGFAVPHAALRLWHPAGGEGVEFTAAPEETRAFAASLLVPYCSHHAMLDTGGWFGEAAAHLRSYAYIALRGEQPFGLLALASEDPRRFYPEMGTIYLRRMGEVLSASLERVLAAGARERAS